MNRPVLVLAVLGAILLGASYGPRSGGDDFEKKKRDAAREMLKLFEHPPIPIEQGVTTRTEIIETFGHPLEDTEDGRFMLYSYGRYRGLYVVGQASSYNRIYDYLPGTEYTGRRLLEFDSRDRVEREINHRCKEPDPRCDEVSIRALLAMLEKYYGAPLARKYKNLCLAAKLSDPAMAKALLADGADSNERCAISGEPVLHTAAFYDNEAGVTEVLLEHRVDISTKDSAGRTAFQVAMSQGNSAVAQLLLANGAEVNSKDPYDRTPLHWAARWDDGVMVRKLLEAGAAVNVVDEDGKTPLDLASDQEVIEILKQYAKKK